MKHPIAFDFDGTITLNNEYPNCGILRAGIDDCIRKLALDGYPIIIYTCRATTTEASTEAYCMMVEYLRDNGIMYTCINSNAIVSSKFNPHKPFAAIYVDDCALGWDDHWNGDDIYKLIMSRLFDGRVNSLDIKNMI